MKIYQKELINSPAFCKEDISNKLPSTAEEGDRLDIEVHGIELSVVFSTDPQSVLEAYLEALEVTPVECSPMYIGIEAPASKGVEALEYQNGVIVVNTATWIQIRKQTESFGNPVNKLNGVTLTVTEGIQFVAPHNCFTIQKMGDGFWIGVLKPEGIIKITTV